MESDDSDSDAAPAPASSSASSSSAAAVAPSTSGTKRPAPAAAKDGGKRKAKGGERAQQEVDDIKDLAEDFVATGSISSEMLGVLTTDRGSNIRKMADLLRSGDSPWLPAKRACAVHMFESATQAALNDKRLHADIIRLLNALQKLPVYFRKAPKRMRLLSKAGGKAAVPMGTIARTRFYTREVQGRKVLANAAAIIQVEAKAMEFSGKNKAKHELTFSENKSVLAAAIMPLAGGGSLLANVLDVLKLVKDAELIFSGASYNTLPRLSVELDVIDTGLACFEKAGMDVRVKIMAGLVREHIVSYFNANGDLPHAWAASLLDPSTVLTIAMSESEKEKLADGFKGEIAKRLLEGSSRMFQVALDYKKAYLKELQDSELDAAAAAHAGADEDGWGLGEVDEEGGKGNVAKKKISGGTEYRAWVKKEVLPKTRKAAEANISCAQFWSRLQKTVLNPTVQHDEGTNWKVTFATVHYFLAIQAAEIPTGRDGSTLTRLVNDERTLLLPQRISRLATLRTLTGKDWARKPRWQRKTDQPKKPDARPGGRAITSSFVSGVGAGAAGAGTSSSSSTSASSLAAGATLEEAPSRLWGGCLRRRGGRRLRRRSTRGRGPRRRCAQA